jgi:hypothetical protein
VFSYLKGGKIIFKINKRISKMKTLKMLILVAAGLLIFTGSLFSQTPWSHSQLGSANYPASVDNWTSGFAVGIGRPVGEPVWNGVTGYGDYYYNYPSSFYPGLLVHSMYDPTYPVETGAILRLQGYDRLNPTDFGESEVQFWSGEYQKNGEWQVGKIEAISSKASGILPPTEVGGGLALYSRSITTMVQPFNNNPVGELFKTMSIYNGNVAIHDPRPETGDILGKLQVNVGGWNLEGSRIVMDHDDDPAILSATTYAPEPTLKFYRPDGVNSPPNKGGIAWISTPTMGVNAGISFAIHPSAEVFGDETFATMEEVARFRKDGKIVFPDLGGSGNQMVTVDNDGVLRVILNK